MNNTYTNGYQDALAWARALVELLGSTARGSQAKNQVHRVELDAAAGMAEEIGRQIDDHVAEFLKLDKGPVH
jgi:hypothetical protein